MKHWLALAAQRPVLMTALRVGAVVGTLLAAINYGDRLLYDGALSARDLFKIALTYLVPYGVSTYSSVQTLRRTEKRGL